MIKVYLANPRGFCAGVSRAIGVVERALAIFKAPIYVRHEVVHNRFIIEDFERRGVVFTDKLSEVPEGAVVIFSAHGVSDAVVAQAKARHLQVFDATCPLVTKVHMEVARYAAQDLPCLLIGHAGHPEVEGTMGRYNSDQSKMHLIETWKDVERLTLCPTQPCAIVTQTTLSVDDTATIVAAIKKKYPQVIMPKKQDICYATQNRQDAVRQLAKRCDMVLVVGSYNSSNATRLSELAKQLGCAAYLIEDAKALQKNWFQGVQNVGVTAGASTPDHLIQELLQSLQSQWGASKPESLPGPEETIHFALPKALRD